MSSQQPPVTWLLPVKNGMPYLPLTLESIASQSYGNHKILARDDGSTDETLNELKRWIPSHIPGQVFSGPSLGIGLTLASLVEQAETELCARIDGDDINLPHRLQRQVEFMQAHPEVGVLGSYVQVMDKDGAKGGVWIFDSSDAEIRWLTRYACRLCHPTVMFRRAAVMAAGNYRDIVFGRDSSLEDWDLWMRMVTMTEMHNIPEPLIYYRRSSTSITGQVENWYEVMRSIAAANTAMLFPGVLDPAAALELWECAIPPKFKADGPNVEAKLWQLRQLRRSAELLAAQCGKPRNYFTGTESFVLQYFLLKRRLLRRFRLGPLLKLRDYLAGKKT